MGVSHDLRGDSWGCVPRSLFWREDLDGDGERGFDCLTFALVLSKAHREGCRASRGGFPYWLPLTDFFCEVLQYFKVYISRLNPFGCAKLTTFIIMCKAYGCEPSVDLFREMAFRNFIYTEYDDDLAFLPKEPSPRFGTGSPSALVNTELPKDVEEPEAR
ncbi:hypothetical protein Tco_0729523 [Tanacetum coccineum]|uniref:Transposase (putative) gypsy type domain-containing protein n=1 Tax=Tanacetum coccineum TaxID=301880 RepID=A0ABQ4YRW1_9ASTR